jgi:DNA-binding GntR family transcriptional regulator
MDDLVPPLGAPRPDGELAAEEAGGTLAQAALDRIIGLIRSGELKPGGILNEADLSKRFGMSRGPVREAVRQLEGRKLVRREPYQRARVAEYDLREIHDIYEVREALEGMACRLATRRMSDEQLVRLVEQVESARRPENYSFIFTDHGFNLHEVVVRECGNARIQEILCQDLYDMVRLYRWSHDIGPAKDGPALRDHWQICRAMLARDEDLAESLMRAHLQRVMRLVREGSGSGER